MEMDMRISGSGKIPSGEYNKISISGSGKLYGNVRCVSFASSGSSKGEVIECAENFGVAGSSSFSGDVKAQNVRIAGSFSCDGELVAQEKISCAGSVSCKKSVKSDVISVAGTLKAGGDVEAEEVKVDGALNCEGLLNAENIRIEFEKGMNIGSIGGSKIVVSLKKRRKMFKRLPLFSSIAEGIMGVVKVSLSIEGDEIALECVSCPRVTGRVVAIGAGCVIDYIQYSEDVEISPDAKVGRTEKI